MHAHFALVNAALAVLVATASLLVPTAAAAQTVTAQPGAGLTVEAAHLVERTTLRRVNDPVLTGQLEITTQAIAIRQGDALQALLTERGVRPGGSAYSVVYELNPWLTNVNQLPAGAELILPALEFRSAAGSTPEQVLVQLETHSALRRQAELEVAGSWTRLSTLSTDLARFDGERARQFSDELRELSGALANLPLRTTAASPQSLQLLSLELRSIEELASRALTEGRALTESEVGAIREMRTTVGSVSSCVRQNWSCRITVRVNTIDPVTGRALPNRNVMAATAGVVLGQAPCFENGRCVERFRRISSPAEHELVTGVPYIIWAVDASGKEVWTRTPHTPRTGIQNTIDLLLSVER